jgi:Fic family protein
MKKKALISVFDKSKLEELLEVLDTEYDFISSSGTATFIKNAGYKVTEVQDLSNFPEILSGRVKTLHPKIFGAILYDRNNHQHLEEIEKENIVSIDLVIVNLYPFAEITKNLSLNGGTAHKRTSSRLRRTNDRSVLNVHEDHEDDENAEIEGCEQSRNVEGIVEMTLDATQQFTKPLTKKRMFNWHAALFPTGRSGMYRITVASWRTKDTDPMQVVSGPIGKEKVHFEAPSAARLKKEMREFLAWFDHGDDTDPVIKAGIAHLWFVTIHPFEDGNGRIARAIGDMALARADGTQNRFYSLSSQIEAERKQYYDELEKQQRATPDITDWLSWFLDCLGRAISNAEITLGNVLFKAQLWDIINQKPVNDRQRLIINRMLEDNFAGFMNTSKYAKLAKCSNDTALRDIQELKERGIFLQNSSGGRSTSYRLPNLNELP